MNMNNATLLSIAPLSKSLPIASLVLVALFVYVEPEATNGYTLFESLLFWTVHIGLGLLVLLFTSYLLTRMFPMAKPGLRLILLSGMIGAVILSPVYLGLEYLMPDRLQQPADGALDLFAERGLLAGVVVQFIEVLPLFMFTWLAINLPLLLNRYVAPAPSPGPDDFPPGTSQATDKQTLAEPETQGSSSPRVSDQTDISSETSEQSDVASHDKTNNLTSSASAESESAQTKAFTSTLPNGLGNDIVAISSDLHYLHVHTTLGRCMLLGSLKHVATQLGSSGMQVHRSHWVAHNHVQRLTRNGQALECVMSNGLCVPVSRRKRSEVNQWHGQDARKNVASSN